MALQFHVPDEYVQGLLKASEKLFQSFGHTNAKEPLPAATVPARLRMAQLQGRYWQQQWALGMSLLGAAQHEGREPVVASQPGDRRFNGKEWQRQRLARPSQAELPAELAAADGWVEATEVDEKGKAQAALLRTAVQRRDGPANFAATNPEAWKMALESGAKACARGSPTCSRTWSAAASRSPTRVPSKSVATSRSLKGPWCSRTICSS